jgi:sulfatase modifying factor 1
VVTMGRPKGSRLMSSLCAVAGLVVVHCSGCDERDDNAGGAGQAGTVFDDAGRADGVAATGGESTITGGTGGIGASVENPAGSGSLDASAETDSGPPPGDAGSTNDPDPPIDPLEEGPVPPSCAESLSCGPYSCCASFAVPGGEFEMGCAPDEPDCLTNEQPEHRTIIAPFRLDAFEVTVARFRAFVEAFPPAPAPGDGAHPLIEGSGWNSELDAVYPATREELIQSLDCEEVRETTWSPTPGPKDNQPIICVSWQLAFAFCHWDEGRLPTEAEWEYAAAGGAEERLYPWGNSDPTTEHAAFDCLLVDDFLCSVQDRAVVGSFPRGRGRWGHYDLAGNQAEWLLDTFEPYPLDTECDNCAVVKGANYVGRGGNFVDEPRDLRTYARDSAGNEYLRTGFMGFRCARAMD